MVRVSGPLVNVTTSASSVRDVQVHTKKVRAWGDGLMTPDPSQATLSNGEVEFEAAPGPVVMVLFMAEAGAETVSLVVGEGATQSLADAYRDGQMASDRDAGELAGILEQIRESVGASAEARAGAEAAAEDAAGSAVSAGRDAARAETAEAGAVEAEEGAEEGQELSEDAAAVAVAAAVGAAEASSDKADAVHEHTVGQVEGLDDALAAKADKDATETALASKADTAYVDAQDQALGERITELLPSPYEHYEIIVDADYTGATDARPAIQAAIDQGHAEGRPVRMRPGTLRLGGSLVPRDGTVLRGSGMGKTILRPQSTASAISYNAGIDSVPLNDVIFTDFEIDGSDQVMPTNGYTATLTKGIFIEKMNRIEMRNLYIHDTGATGLGIDHVTGVIENVWAVGCGRLNNGIQPGGSGIGIGVGWLDPEWEPLTIAHCHTEGNARFGIFIETQSANVMPSGITITGCTARGNRDGIGDCGSTGTVITGNHVTGNTRSGIDVDHGTLSRAAPGVQTKIIGNDIRENQTGITIYVKPADGMDGIQVLDNTITGNVDDGIYFNSDTSDSDLTPVRNLKIGGNEVSRNGNRGIYIEGDRYQSFLILRRFWIVGNRVWENAGGGIHVTANTNGMVIEGNHAWDDQEVPTQTSSIFMEKTHTGLVERNNLWGSGTVTVPAA